MGARKPKRDLHDDLVYFKSLIVKAEAGDPEAAERLTVAINSVNRFDRKTTPDGPEGHYGMPTISEDTPYTERSLALYEEQKKKK